MAYVLTTYFIGVFSRYDRIGKNDYATIALFASKERAIQYVIDFIIGTVAESNADLNQNRVISHDAITKIRKKLNENDYYTFDDTYMFIIEYAEIIV